MDDPRGRFHPARLVFRKEAGGGLTEVNLETTPRALATFRSPGQYVEVRAEGQTGFFVLANEPGASSWALILRAGGGASDVLMTMDAGARLEVTEALGAGFPMPDARGNPLVVALGGTGIAAGPPLIHRRIAEGDAGRTEALVGVRRAVELPMRSELESWMSAGVGVLVCLSQREGSIVGIDFEYGYVQDVLRARALARRQGRAPLARDTRIFAVGMDSMVLALKTLAPELGLSPHRVYTNH